MQNLEPWGSGGQALKIECFNKGFNKEMMGLRILARFRKLGSEGWASKLQGFRNGLVLLWVLRICIM